ncbi:signal transduction protein [Mycobacteroides abscessus]|uniref:signal transduction protein n=1 Tax=Mycobacteroides abscessus TaxID=36809 RepID=UPI000C263A5B
MDTKYLRTLQYDPTEWEDRVKDANGNVLVEGVPVNEVNLNNVEAGILLSHFDIGILSLFLMQQTNLNRLEIEKYKKQRLQQGQATITNNISDTGYFRTSDPFATISLSGFSQINAPDYDVIISPTSADDMGKVGDLIVYDKTQNGFKVKMTGSAKTVSFLWTLINPNV